MSEPRKVPLISNGFGATTGPPDKKKKPLPARSQRFTLTLSDPTDTFCSEFSYLDLCTKAVESATPEIDPNDPFAAKDKAEHDSMVRMAQAYEAKYAPKPGGKRKRRDRVEDLVDLGDGYDESDSFVDNTEAYDEYIPCTMSTKHGGFYINCGQLDLVPVDEEFLDNGEDDGDAEEIPMRKKRRNNNRLSDSDECSSEGQSKHKNGEGFVKKKRNKELFVGMKKRRRSSLGEPQAASGLSRKSEKSLTVPALLGASTPNPGATAEDGPADVKPVIPAVAEKLRECLSARSTNQAQSSAPVVDPSPSAVSITAVATQSSIDSAIEAVISRTREDSDNPPNSPLAKPPVYTLPAEVLDAVLELTTLAGRCEGKKIRQFTPEVSALLLRVDALTRGTPCATATHGGVFTELGRHFACGWEGLMKRVRKLRLSAQ